MAAGQGQTAAVGLLLKHGAHVDPRSTSDETPLIMAARSKHKFVVEALLKHGADTSATTNYKPPMAKSAQQYMDEM